MHSNQRKNQSFEDVTPATTASNDEISVVGLLKTIVENQAKQFTSVLPMPRCHWHPCYESPRLPIHTCQHHTQNQSSNNIPAGTSTNSDESSIMGLLKTIIKNQNQQATLFSPMTRCCCPAAFQQATVLDCQSHCQCQNQIQNHSCESAPAASKDDPSLKSQLQTVMKNLNKVEALVDHVVTMQEKIVKHIASQPVHTMDTLTRPQFKKIDSVEDCHDFEEKLKNFEYVQEMIKHFSSVCGANSDLYGDNVAYALVDHVFTRRLFTLVTWTGVSRGTESKESFQQFERIFQFFFDLIRKVDSEYSIKSLKDFFQKMISNSKRRLEQKGLRTSRVKLSSGLVVRKRKRCLEEKVRGLVRRNSNVEGEQETISDEITDNDEDYKDNLSLYSNECVVDDVTQMREAGWIKAEQNE